MLYAFPDEHLAARVRCYALEEIAAEKVGASLHVRDSLNRFAAQGRVDSACLVRDMYDPWYLKTSRTESF